MGVIKLELFVADIAAALASFDTMRIRRSVTGETGPFSEITAATATKATLLGTLSSPFSVSGKTLQLKVDSLDQVNMTFTGTNPLSIAQVVSQVNAAIAGIASDVSGKLQLQSTTTGTASKMQVVGGSAITDLGFTTGERTIGSEPYITLVTGQTSYLFSDRDGESGYYYEASYYHTVNHLTSQWSEPFRGEPGTLIDSSKLSVGSIDSVNAAGVAQEGQRITFFPLHDPFQVDGYQVALLNESITIETDSSGHAEVTLVRGLKVKVVFEGTSLIREITIPDTATFNLLDLISAAPDPYNPIEPDYPSAIRRSI